MLGSMRVEVSLHSVIIQTGIYCCRTCLRACVCVLLRVCALFYVWVCSFTCVYVYVCGCVWCFDEFRCLQILPNFHVFSETGTILYG